mgnify:CR=1 FL=1
MRITLHPNPYKIAPGVHRAFEYAFQNRDALLRELMLALQTTPDVGHLFTRTPIDDGDFRPYIDLTTPQTVEGSNANNTEHG